MAKKKSAVSNLTPLTGNSFSGESPADAKSQFRVVDFSISKTQCVIGYKTTDTQRDPNHFHVFFNPPQFTDHWAGDEGSVDASNCAGEIIALIEGQLTDSQKRKFATQLRAIKDAAKAEPVEEVLAL